jgi:putative PIN family toxin of toxin-antitoxin system
MAKVVIDANVLVSSVFGGLPLESITLSLLHHEVYYSEDIEKGLRGVMQKLESKLQERHVVVLQRNLSKFLSFCSKISVTEDITICRDTKDNRYLALCKRIRADYLITGDKDLLTIPKKVLRDNKIFCTIVSPAEFIKQVAR